MTSEKRVQKFHTDDASLPRSGWCFWLVVPHGKFASANQRHYPVLGSDMSSVWNFCIRFSDVILQGNQWRHREIAGCLLRLLKKQTKPGKLYLISRKCTWLTQLDLVTAQGPEWFQNTWRSHSWEPHRVHKRTVSSKFNWFQPSFTCIHIFPLSSNP